MKKLLTSTFLALALLTMSTGVVFAQDTTTDPITGTVQTVELVTDPTTGEVTSVLVTMLDDQGTEQQVEISLETAESLGLVTTDATTGDTTVDETSYGSDVSIDPADVLTGGEEEEQHPVGSALSDFFSDMVGVDYDTIMEYHDDGFGFGVIAQALWLTNQIEGDTTTFTELLDAKQSGDYSNITLADGSTPDNWGDVVKSLKKGENLGSVKSGHADNGTGTETTTEQTTQGNGNGNGNGGGNGNNGNHGNGNGNKGNGGNGKKP